MRAAEHMYKLRSPAALTTCTDLLNAADKLVARYSEQPPDGTLQLDIIKLYTLKLQRLRDFNKLSLHTAIKSEAARNAYIKQLTATQDPVMQPHTKRSHPKAQPPLTGNTTAQQPSYSPSVDMETSSRHRPEDFMQLMQRQRQASEHDQNSNTHKPSAPSKPPPHTTKTGNMQQGASLNALNALFLALTFAAAQFIRAFYKRITSANKGEDAEHVTDSYDDNDLSSDVDRAVTRQMRLQAARISKSGFVHHKVLLHPGL